jgi:hypothetical protein
VAWGKRRKVRESAHVIIPEPKRARRQAMSAVTAPGGRPPALRRCWIGWAMRFSASLQRHLFSSETGRQR